MRKGYDIILIDCPPAIGPIVTSATLASDLIIAPLDPDDYAIDGIQYCHDEVNKLREDYNLNIDFKILLNKYDATRNQYTFKVGRLCVQITTAYSNLHNGIRIPTYIICYQSSKNINGTQIRLSLKLNYETVLD